MSADLPSPDALDAADRDAAEAAAHAAFASIQAHADPDRAHDLGGVSSIWHEEQFDAIVAIACRVLRDYKQATSAE